MRFPAAASLILAVAATACGPTTDPNNDPSKLANLERAVFGSGGCTGCHFDSSPTSNAGLNLTLGNSHLAMVGKASRVTTWAGTPWEGKKLVEPGDPDNSLLVITLEQPEGLPEALRMPSGTSKIPADKIANIRKWIEDGALAQ